MVKFRIFMTAITATVFLSESAFALSCMRPDIAQTMETAKASDDLYYILVGKFISEDVPDIKKAYSHQDQFKTRPPRIVRTLFEGHSLSNTSQFDMPLTRFPVDVKVTCAGSWCGGVPSGEGTHIAFVKARPNQAPLLTAGACPDKVFRLDPKKSQLSKLRDCFDKACISGIDPRFDKH